MLHMTFFEITHILTVAATFITHYLSFYDLTVQWETNMWIVEGTVFGTYFSMKLGYLVAVLTDGTFTRPLEAMTKLYGAVLYNVLGLISIIEYVEDLIKHSQNFIPHNLDIISLLLTILPFVKGVLALMTSVFYYIEVFQT